MLQLDKNENTNKLKLEILYNFLQTVVKLRQGSGKERQGKARKGKDGER